MVNASDDPDDPWEVVIASSVWICVWMGECKTCSVKRFWLEMYYINTEHLPFTIYILQEPAGQESTGTPG